MAETPVGVSSAPFTIDELAQRAGTLTSTVRMYQHRGLLMRPTAKRGRVALYGDEHLERLRLIADLQARGHSLAGIGELLESWQDGADLDELLGISTWGAPRPVVVPVRELMMRLGGAQLTQDDLRRAARLGLVEIEGESARVTDLRFLEVGGALVEMGVPAAAVLDEWVWLMRRAETIAARFTALFERELWPRYADAVADPLAFADLRATLERLGPLAATVTGVALEWALRDAASGFLARHAPTDAPTEPPASAAAPRRAAMHQRREPTA